MIRKDEEFKESRVQAVRRPVKGGSPSARPKDWSALPASNAVASEEFMRDVEDLPVQERELWSGSKR